MAEPQSRNESILQSIVDGTEYTEPPRSRVEDLLIQVKEVIEEGGGGGTKDYEELSNKPQIGGVTLTGNKTAADLSLASLENGKVPAAQLPSYVDDVLEYDDLAHFPAEGESGKIYVAKDTNKTYRWSGTAYVEISESLALGETASTAYAGNKGKANADAIEAIKDGEEIDSFSDVENVLADKQDTITAGTYIQMQNNEISVKRDISQTDVVINYVINTVGMGSLTLKKYIDGTQVGDTVQYEYNTIVGIQNIDDLFTISFNSTTANWEIINTVASSEHPASYVKTMFRSVPAEYSQTFATVIDADKKLIIQSELDEAIAGVTSALSDVSDAVEGIKDGQTMDSFADVESAVNELNSNLTDLGLSVVNGKLCQTYNV